MTDSIVSNTLQHLALILDGNGRWAIAHGLPVVEGHRRGAEALREVVRDAWELGIKYLTVYAFSTENWRRSKLEVSGIMQILRYNLKKKLNELLENNVRILILGDISRFPKDLIPLIENAVQATKDNTGLTLLIALNYGGRAEIVRAARLLAEKIQKQEITPEDIDEKLFSEHIYTKDIPDPDLLLRPGCEKRLSNYLLWQTAYTEFMFTETLWPDFSKKDLEMALQEFNRRQRRFGGDTRVTPKKAS